MYTNTFGIFLNKYVWNLFKTTKLVTLITISQDVSRDTKSRFYRLPKIYKASVPLCLVVPFVNAATNNLSSTYLQDM